MPYSSLPYIYIFLYLIWVCDIQLESPARNILKIIYTRKDPPLKPRVCAKLVPVQYGGYEYGLLKG